jgi:hypothetical protein
VWPSAVIGALIDMKAVEKAEAHIADAVKKGAKVFTGGTRGLGRHLRRADRADRCEDAKFVARATAPDHEFGYYGVPGLDTMRGG